MIPQGQERALIAEIQKGLPLVSHPYAAIADRIGMSESQVIQKVNDLQDGGAIKRMGVVVRHHELGYRSNAMVVWDAPDAQIKELGSCFSQFEFITLCYQRPRRLPQWRYNLFCMIHGQDRESVLDNLQQMSQACDVEALPHEVLFSCRRFKQRGALYVYDADSKQSQQSKEPIEL
ncbi:MAG: AsnC family protein [Sulfuriflexus sp.]|nr:AsnC family protein [Sulfuriflexus sp.]